MRRPQAGRLSALPLIMCLAYALLLTAWVVGDPPFAAPDEWSHYLRTIGVADGHLIGEPYAYPVAPTATDFERRTAAWVNDAARLVRVPPGLFVAGFDCNARRPDVSAACLDRLTPTRSEVVEPTPVGNYQPLPYLLPAAVITIAADPFTADWLGRAVSALACWAFLALGILLLWDGRATSLIGPLVAVSPMTLFIGASLTPSGLEICSGFLLTAALLHLWREERAGGSVWLIAGAAGAMLALSRSTGPLYVALDLLIFGALVGPRGLWGRAHAHPFAAALGGLLISLGVLLSRLWERAYGSHLRIDPAGLPAQVVPAFRRVVSTLPEFVGVFGALDTVLPYRSAALWLLALGIVIVIALVAGTRTERLVLLVAALGNLATVFGFSVLLVVGTTFDVQGRHVLPLAVMVPLLAGAIVARRAERLPALLAPARAGRWALATLAGFVGVFHCFAWYWNARRHAVGLGGPIAFFARAEWSPPGGWWPWAALLALGAALLILPLLPRRAERREMASQVGR